MTFIIQVSICIWIIFFNGSRQIADTLSGYVLFGSFADKHNYIKALAVMYLIMKILIYMINK
ncbi:hypothetical protein GCM10007894_03550 [Paraferrimonas haliotis]|uniref:Uncharacterized protein n=1 Tax=Paraferrimonas haliotis TaxID=2013866 RepID=A0AA37TKY3_9GAMM|nr:hypothetical protein GCM10007894_03550 [Paraferrimonas haliotis]